MSHSPEETKALYEPERPELSPLPLHSTDPVPTVTQGGESGVANGEGEESRPALGLPEFEVHAIELFIRLARLFGLSKSIGEIYGLLFVCPTPAPLETVREKLKMSTGSASQGLRLLRSVGAIRAVYVPGDRRDHYVVETGLATIASGFLREKMAPNLFNQDEQIAGLFGLMDEIPATHRPFLQERLRTLQNWHRQAKSVLSGAMEGLRAEEHAV